MILDASAIVAVLLEELDQARLVEAMEIADVIAVGTPTLFEANLVMVRRYDVRGRSLVARFLEENDIMILPFGEDHWRVASEAYVRYGKGRHPARLNYGDCMAYATAKIAGAPLLFVGDDFTQTDISVA